MKTPALMAFCVSCVSCAFCAFSDEMQLEKRMVSGTEARLLDNQLLQAVVVPAASGCIAGLQYAPTGHRLFPEFRFEREKMDLLPDVISANSAGGRMALWGRPIFGTQKFRILEEEATAERVAVTLGSDYFQHESVGLTREIALPAGKAAVEIKAVFRNLTERPLKITPWDNLLAQLDSRTDDEVLMPSRGGVGRLGGRGMEQMDKDRIWREDRSRHRQLTTAPARGWIARRNSNVPYVLAIRASRKDVLPEGMLYSWHEGDRLQISSELIFNPHELPPGGRHAIRYEYLVFQGLKDLKEIVGPYGLDCVFRSGRIDLDLASVQQVAPGRVSLGLKNEADGIVDLGNRDFDSLRPGVVRTLRFALPQDLAKGEYRVTGRISTGEVFELLEPVVRIR